MIFHAFHAKFPSEHTGSQERTPDLQGKKLPEHSQRRFCYYELRGGINEFASAASKMLKSDGKFCNFAALDAAGKHHKLDCQQGHFERLRILKDSCGFFPIESICHTLCNHDRCCPRHRSRPPPSGRRSCCHTCRRLGPGATIDRAGAGGSEVASAGVWYQPLGYNDATYGIAAIALTQKKPEKCMDLKP